MQRTAATVAACLLGLTMAAGAARAGVVLPHDGDAYSRLVARAEADDAKVDFHALRFAWLDSRQRARAADDTAAAKTMHAAVAAQNAAGVRAAAEQVISIDYTDMEAHKFRRQACHLLGDAACEQHEHFVEFGLLNSIVKGKDGGSPATAWEVSQVKEEYFILAMAGYTPGAQALLQNGGRAFDRLEAADEHGASRSFYFDITVMLPKELPTLK
jgi:hypothetical protein